MTDTLRRRPLWFWAVGIGLPIGMCLPTGGASSAHAAEAVEVQFDCGAAVVCRDVTGFEDVAGLGAGEKVVEATFCVTVRVSQGKATDLTEVGFELFSPGRRARVARFSPVTHLATDVVDPIHVTHTIDTKKSLGGTLGITMAAPAPIQAQLTPALNLGVSRHESMTQEHLQIPALHPVVVSGTMRAQHGVFFKFKPSSQTTLEGVQKLTCQWIVPDTWRGDWLLLSCRATGERSKILWTHVEPCGSARYVVGLYLEGDAGARQAARRLARAQLAPAHGTDRYGASRGNERHTSRVRVASESLEHFAGDS